MVEIYIKIVLVSYVKGIYCKLNAALQKLDKALLFVSTSRTIDEYIFSTIHEYFTFISKCFQSKSFRGDGTNKC